MAPSKPDGQTTTYRGDIDGLRAVAIIVVVAYHAHVPGFSGGFVGVDVFFVISGWLITQQLLQPVEQGRPPGLLGFWARRVRRLIPASTLMITVTLLASVVILSPLELGLIVERAVAAALYVSNLLFAASAGDYFSGPLQTSPYLHTWSLGVEEQFYLVWPFVFVVLGKAVAAKPTFDARRGLLLAMGGVLMVSFGVNVQLTNAGSAWAFYGLPARAWEFAAAGFAVAAMRARPAWTSTWRAVAAVSGALLIVWSVVRFDDTTPFPGTAALVPVAGTILLILAGHALGPGQKGLLEGLDVAPMRTLGKLSYSWYLWHWPFIVLAVAITYDDTAPMRLLAALAALPVAALAHHWVENPLRYSERLRASKARTFAMGGIATALCLGLAAAVYAYGHREVQQSPHREYEVARQSYRFGCDELTSDGGIAYCEAGDANAAVTVLLSGDSHAGQWVRAFSEVADRSGIRLLYRAVGNCTATPNPDVSAEDEPVSRRGCAQWLEDTESLITEMQPNAIVLADAARSRDLAFPGGPEVWGAATQAFVNELAAEGIHTGLVIDNPFSEDPLLCLSRGRPESLCTPTPSEALAAARRYGPAEDALTAPDGELPTLDVNEVICTSESCRLEHDGVWIFAASGHITEDFTFTQLDAVEGLLDQLASPG